MNNIATANLTVRTFNSVAQVGEAAWDEFSGGQPFQSAKWYQFGEVVMDECQPVYIFIYQEGRAIARATFWVNPSEPLPVPKWINSLLVPLIQHWPLFSCRSPLSNLTGLILPEGELGNTSLMLIISEAERQATLHHCSFILFDYLTESQVKAIEWPSDMVSMPGGDPGNQLKVKWQSFQDYVASLPKSYRDDIKRHQKKASELNVQVRKSASVSSIENSLSLIRALEDKYRSAHNPWAQRLLENNEMVDSTFFEAYRNGQQIGCGLVIYDNKDQYYTLLGRNSPVMFDYFMMIFVAIDEAIQKGCNVLHLGSGTYDVKRHLGCELEYNNEIAVKGTGWLSKLLIRLVAPFVREATPKQLEET